MTLGDYSQERAKTEYACMSSDDSTVGLGSITRAPLEFTGLYNEETADGQELLKQAFSTNSNTTISIEFANGEAGSNGTTLLGLFGISKYVMSFPKDGKIGVAFTLEFIDTPALTIAGALGAKALAYADYTGSLIAAAGDVILTLDSDEYTFTAVIGDTDLDIVEGLAGLINTAALYSASTEGGKLNLEALLYGIVGNDVTVVDSSTDTGIVVTTVDFAGGVDPV